MNKGIIFLLFIFFLVSSCSIQQTLNPEEFQFEQAKNIISQDYANIILIERATITKLNNKQITVQQAIEIDNTIKDCRFNLDLAQKLLSAGNYTGASNIANNVLIKLSPYLSKEKVNNVK